MGRAVRDQRPPPVLGLVTFSVGVLIMLMLMGRFGLEVDVSNQPSASDTVERIAASVERVAATASSGPAAPPPDSKLARPAPAWR